MNWSWVHTIETSTNFPMVLKILGIVMFGGSFFMAWSHIPLFWRVVMLAGVLVFFVGLRYKKVVKPVQEAPLAAGAS